MSYHIQSLIFTSIHYPFLRFSPLFPPSSSSSPHLLFLSLFFSTLLPIPSLSCCFSPLFHNSHFLFFSPFLPSSSSSLRLHRSFSFFALPPVPFLSFSLCLQGSAHNFRTPLFSSLPGFWEDSSLWDSYPHACPEE